MPESQNSQYDFGFEDYDRCFKVPLKTHYGDWSIRQGIFVYLRDQFGAVGVGEISPLPGFGTESIEEAIAFCSSLPQHLALSEIIGISAHLPSVQFGFGTALEALQCSPCSKALLSADKICGLLPAGLKALTVWKELWQQGHRTFKWKIGVEDIETELFLFQSLMSQLPPRAKLRLDANGGLTLDQAQCWVSECDRYQRMSQSPAVEYVEQPLPPSQWQQLLWLSHQFKTAIALDESVATLADLETWQQRNWPGFYVLKPAIMGFPQAIRQVCRLITNPMIVSSVFEASVGRRKALELAQDLSSPEFALGFGVDHWLAESPSVSISSSIFS